jgi:hypothetical protein
MALTAWRPRASLAIRDPLQLPFDGPGAAEQSPVEPGEPPVRRIKHEAARDADRDPDRAAIELDRETLCRHDNSSPDGQPPGSLTASAAAVRSIA